MRPAARTRFAAILAWPLLAWAPIAGADTAASAQDRSPPNWNLLDRYCTECHNTVDWAGGLALDSRVATYFPAPAAVK